MVSVYWLYFFSSGQGMRNLKHFLNLCNNYSKSKGMKSKVKFMYSYWTSTVNFLDVTVKVEKDVTLSTTHFAKPTASCQCLHAKFSHPFHTMKALPKSQFVRIRRTCTLTFEYWKHKNTLMNVLTKRGYKKPALLNCNWNI